MAMKKYAPKHGDAERARRMMAQIERDLEVIYYE